MQEEYQPPGGSRPGPSSRGKILVYGTAGSILAAGGAAVNDKPSVIRHLDDAASDVPPVDLARPVDLVHRRVGPLQRSREVGGHGADREDPAAGTDQLAVLKRGAGVKD